MKGRGEKEKNVQTVGKILYLTIHAVIVGLGIDKNMSLNLIKENDGK